jgi:plasmid replication initiation protein
MKFNSLKLTSLTSGEKRLIFKIISMIQPNDEDFKSYQIRFYELAELLNADKNNCYEDCQKITKNLLGKVIEIQESKKLIQARLFSSVEFSADTNLVSLTINPLLMTYLKNVIKTSLYVPQPHKFALSIKHSDIPNSICQTASKQT